MKLTEAQISSREEIFYELVEFIINEEYKIDEEYITTEEDIAIANGVMEYFVESFKEPTLQEAISSVMSGEDINEELYLEIVENLLLDESIGTAIAGAVHGIGSWNADRKAKNATEAATKAHAAHTDAVSKATSHAAGASNGGWLHKFKQTYLNTKANKAKANVDAAVNKSVDLDRAARAKKASSLQLAAKIDKHVAAAGHKAAHIAGGGEWGATPDTHTPEAPKPAKIDKVTKPTSTTIFKKAQTKVSIADTLKDRMANGPKHIISKSTAMPAVFRSGRKPAETEVSTPAKEVIKNKVKAKMTPETKPTAKVVTPKPVAKPAAKRAIKTVAKAVTDNKAHEKSAPVSTKPTNTDYIERHKASAEEAGKNPVTADSMKKRVADRMKLQKSVVK